MDADVNAHMCTHTYMCVLLVTDLVFRLVMASHVAPHQTDNPGEEPIRLREEGGSRVVVDRALSGLVQQRPERGRRLRTHSGRKRGAAGEEELELELEGVGDVGEEDGGGAAVENLPPPEKRQKMM